VYKDDQNVRVVDKLTETELAYAANCPVTITQEDGSEVEGTVLLPKASTSHFKTILYTVMMPVGGSSQAQYVDGIGAKQIKYRKIDPEIKCDVLLNESVEQTKEITPTSNTQSTSAADDKDLDKIHVESKKEEVPSSIVCGDSVGKRNNKVDIDSSITSNNTLSTYNNADDHKHMHYGPSSMKDSRDDDSIRTIEIKVPVWVQRDDFKQLFFHLIGSKHQHLRGKRNTSDIERETGCKIGIFYFDRSTGKRLSSASKGCPMIIRIGSGKRSRNPYLDLNVAREKIQDLLLDFVGRDGCRGRLLYETASSVEGLHRPTESLSRAIRAKDPFPEQGEPPREVFMTLVYFPFIVNDKGKKHFHAEFLLVPELLNRLWSETGCYVKACINIPGMISVRRCFPYLLVMGKLYQDVDRAVGILNDEVKNHMHSCTCSMIRH